PFMALLILAALQMLPREIIEVARLDGANPWQIFWRVTLPLIRPAVMVAVIFRALDALRIFDLIYVLTPNNAHTKSMSVFARENLFEFDKFAYGSAASTLLFLILALLTILTIRVGRISLEGGH
ncbi:MAG: sugar ABC transporter permease, partial [Mesorhizobium sp.]